MGTKSADIMESLKPWGLLKGIRPGKIVHHLWDQGKNDEEVTYHLQQRYQVSTEKIRLLLEVCHQERVCFHSSGTIEQDWGVYIGIPFCPSKCIYCSFPSHPLSQVKDLVDPFFKTLLEEIQVTMLSFPELSEKVTCLYLGGGTPACLTPTQLEQLLQKMHEFFPLLEEITFEGGRPERMTREILQAVKPQVQRICINPQTMNDAGLKRIGRMHTSKHVLQAMEIARHLGFSWINMDFIAGLPEETEDEFRDSLIQAIALSPENITIHALAIKRASAMKQDDQIMASLDHRIAETMITASQALLTEAGYKPYYLYRQRDIMAGAENVGYTKPGYASRYNTLMIAERMNILGFGVGAASKFLKVKSQETGIYRIANPKDLFVYLKRGAVETAEKKFKIMKTILRGEENVD
jgi:oxygen-independent coproporphyrinogen-3 oxidase